MRIEALNSGFKNPGVIHVETDSDFVPPAFRARDGEQVVVFGRWIVDCGHDNFQSEIHPPLIQARGTSPDGLTTKSTVIGRPYLVTQDFEHGDLKEHLLNQIGQLPSLLLAPPPFDLAIAGRQQLTARTKVLTTPFRGVQLFYYYVRPPIKRPAGSVLSVTYGLTVRTGVKVSLVPASGNTGTIVVGILLDESTYKPPALPSMKDWKVPLADIKAEENLGPTISAAQFGATALGNPGVGIVLQNGVVTDRAIFPSVPDLVPVTALASSLRERLIVTVDDNQPFPIRGSIDLGWVKDPRSTRPAPLSGATSAATRRVTP